MLKYRFNFKIINNFMQQLNYILIDKPFNHSQEWFFIDKKLFLI
jgi:hypothetical protein